MNTPSAHQIGKIDALMEQASAALVKREYFECEHFAAAALRKAHALDDFDRMSRILMPLQEARRQKREMALEAGRVFVVNGELPTGKDLRSGCYLVTPPRVGVDGRALREHADQNRVAVLVLVREPTTRDGLWPVVSVGPVTVRAKVLPPEPPKAEVKKKTAKKPGKSESVNGAVDGPALPSVEWFIETSEALGDAAIAAVPETLPGANRVDMLLERLEALPDHEKLHQRLEEAARDAAREPMRKRRPIAEGMFDDEVEDEDDDEE